MLVLVLVKKKNKKTKNKYRKSCCVCEKQMLYSSLRLTSATTYRGTCTYKVENQASFSARKNPEGCGTRYLT